MVALELPGHFYGYDTLIYLVSAVIGFMISYYAYKIYKVTRNKTHGYLFSGFSVLSAGLLTIALTSAYSYIRWHLTGEMIIFDQFFGVDDLGMWIYFGASLIAYASLVMMYAPEKYKDKFLLVLPITANYFTYFNVILFFMVAYVAFRSITNYLNSRSTNTMLVMISFVLIGLYHIILMFTPFYRGFYAFAHLSLILGFLSLLYMLIRVK